MKCLKLVSVRNVNSSTQNYHKLLPPLEVPKMSAEDFEDIEVGEEEEVEDSTLANSDVVTKYQEAAKIANAVGREIVNLVGFDRYYIY